MGDDLVQGQWCGVDQPRAGRGRGEDLGRAGEDGRLLTLAELSNAEIDMLSLVIVGSSATRRLDTDPPRLYTPRGYVRRGR